MKYWNKNNYDYKWEGRSTKTQCERIESELKKKKISLTQSIEGTDIILNDTVSVKKLEITSNNQIQHISILQPPYPKIKKHEWGMYW